METKKNSNGSQYPGAEVKRPSWKRALIHGLIGTGIFVVVLLVIFLVTGIPGIINKTTGDPVEYGYKIGYVVGQLMGPVFIAITAISYLIQKLIFK